MARTSLYPENLYLSPAFAMERLEVLFKRCGVDHVLKKAKFKPEREAFIAALFLLGLSKANKREYWIAINPADEPPDIYAYSFVEKNGRSIRQIMRIEIFEWEGHATKSLKEAILEKLNNVRLPNYYQLLCYVRDHDGEVFDAQTLTKDLEHMKLPIGEVWIVGSIQSFFHDNAIIRVYPKPFSLSFVLKDERRNTKISQGDMYEGKRGTRTVPILLGNRHLPLPDC